MTISPHIHYELYLSWKGYATTTKKDQSELLMYTNGCTSFVFYGSSLLVNDAIYNVWWWMFWIPTSHYGSIIFTIFCKIGLWNSVLNYYSSGPQNRKKLMKLKCFSIDIVYNITNVNLFPLLALSNCA